MEATLGTWLLTQLKCSICKDYMMYYIFQCHDGHNICANCRSIIVRCVSCEAPLEDSRNIFLERMADFITFPYLYHKEGCGQLLSKQDAAPHQQNCFHGPNRCPVLSSESCPWQGNTTEIQTHLLQEHQFLQADIVGGFTTQNINIENAQQWKLQFSTGKESFIRVFVISEGEFYGYIKYLGPDKKLDLFRYKMQLHSQRVGIHSNNGIKTVFKGPVHPCNIPEENIIKNGSCFKVALHTFSDLLNNEFKLSIETSIHT